jgi:tetratricopeptide (TPR) repeat protein
MKTNERTVKRIRNSALGLVLASCACLLALGGTPQAQNDRIVLKGGKDKTVRIKKEDLDGVWYPGSGGAGDTIVKWSEVDSIVYGSADAYQKALETLNSGRVADAASQFEALAANADLRVVLRQNVLFHLAVADVRLGKADEALTRYKELLEGFPKSRYLLPIGSSLLSIHLAKKDVAGAAKALEPVLAAAKDVGPDAPVQAALGILRGRLLEEQKKIDDAASTYDGTLRNPKAEPDVILAAKLGLARCAQKRGQSNDADKRYRELAKGDGPNTLLAGAWNGLGDLALEQAIKSRDQDGLRVALLSYLRGVVLYVPDPGEASDELERSLAGASRAFKSMSELEGNADRKQVYLERARQLRSQLTTQFPGSRFLEE